MEIISFYSYKGGVGRTLALANVANYLLKMNLRVCVLDFDLEAPGLHYKLSENTKIEITNGGIVDIVHNFYKHDNDDIDIKQYAIPIAQKNAGELLFIPAGNTDSPDYWNKLSKINWTDLLYSEERYGMFFFLHLRELIQTQLAPDYLLIDSRTGITEIGGICTSLLADKVLFLFTNNQENIDGTNKVSKAISKVPRFEGFNPIEKYYALTRVPQDIDNQIIETIISQIEDTNISERFVKIYSDSNLERAEYVPLRHKQIDNSLLTSCYIDLFTMIVGVENIGKHRNTLIESISKEEPKTAIAELESLSKAIWDIQINEALLNFCLQSKNKEKFIEVYKNYYDKMNLNIETKYINDYNKFFIDYAKTDKDTNIFDLPIIENYIAKSIKNNKQVTYYLSYTYLLSQKHKEAIDLFCKLLPTRYKLNDVLNHLLDMLNIDNELETSKIFNNYITDILNNYELRLKYCEYIYKINDTKMLHQVIENSGFRDYLIEKKTDLSFNIFSEIYNPKIVLNSYNDLIEKYLKNSETTILSKIGIIYNYSQKLQEFLEKIKSHKNFKIVESEIKDSKKYFVKFENGKIIIKQKRVIV